MVAPVVVKPEQVSKYSPQRTQNTREVEGSPHHPGDQPDQPTETKPSRRKKCFSAHGCQGQTDGQDDQDAQQEGRRALPVQQGDRHGEEQGKDSAAITRPTSRRTSLMFIASSRREGALILIDVVQVQDPQISGDQDHRIPPGYWRTSGMMMSSRASTAIRIPFRSRSSFSGTPGCGYWRWP